MKRLLPICSAASVVVLSCSLGFAATVAPAITGVTNAASNISIHSPIAQGAIFVVYGIGLGPATLSIASKPFQSTSLDGTSVAVKVGDTTLNALMYYTSATQVAALLPSNTPIGSASFAVTYNGQTTPAFTQAVGPNNLGIFTIDSSGQGAAIVTYPDYSLVSPVKAANCGGPNTTCGAANPGDTLTLWATGLGAVSGSDAAGAGLGQNMPGIPVTVWLGGVQAQVNYQGRSGCCIGEDQIVFTVPTNIATGCALPLTVQVGDLVSNTGLIAVANGSRNCTPADPASAALGSTAIEQAAESGAPLKIGDLSFMKSLNGSGGYVDTARFQFFDVTGFVPGTQPFLLSDIDDPPAGTCAVYSNPKANNDVPFANGADLNAGSLFMLTGPAGILNVPSISAFSDSSPTTLSPAGSFLVPGNFTVAGTGGVDVGIFNAKFTLAAAPVTPSAPANNSTITRANGMTVTWNPVAGATGNMVIQVVSATDASFTYGFTTKCVAPANAGSFTIPAYALLPHVPGAAAYYQLYSDQRFPFSAPGLTIGIVQEYEWGPSSSLVLK